jgi:hypothetical protein
MVAEGNSGKRDANFTASLSEASSQTITVHYATAGGTATADTDYVATSGTLTFAPGITTKTFAAQVNGNTLHEPDETYFVNLSSPTNATIFDNQRKGTITTTIPQVDATRVSRPTNVTAKCSEAMRVGTININTVRLFKRGTTTPIAAVVTYDTRPPGRLL